MNKRIKVQIQGVSPLLMNRFPLVPVEALHKLPPEEQAAHAAYKAEDGWYYIPGINIQRCLISAAKFSKGKGRSSLQTEVCACVIIEPERVRLPNEKFTIDSRAVVIAATKGRIVRHRPRFDQWQVGFEIDYDPTLIKGEQLYKVAQDAGSRVGLLDFRPERKGPFGRFIVTFWK